MHNVIVRQCLFCHQDADSNSSAGVIMLLVEELVWSRDNFGDAGSNSSDVAIVLQVEDDCWLHDNLGDAGSNTRIELLGSWFDCDICYSSVQVQWVLVWFCYRYIRCCGTIGGFVIVIFSTEELLAASCLCGVNCRPNLRLNCTLKPHLQEEMHT